MAIGTLEIKVTLRYKPLLYVSVLLFRYVPTCCIKLSSPIKVQQ